MRSAWRQFAAGSSSVNVLPRPGSLSSADLAAVRGDDLLHHRQADAGALDIRVDRRAAAHELAEDRSAARRRDADAAVDHADRRAIVVLAPLDRTRSDRPGEYLMALSIRLRSASDSALSSAATRMPTQAPSISIALPACARLRLDVIDDLAHQRRRVEIGEPVAARRRLPSGRS